MFGYVKKEKLLDEIRAEIQLCVNMIEKYDALIKNLCHSGADSITINSHLDVLHEWEARRSQSVRIFNMVEQTT